MDEHWDVSDARRSNLRAVGHGTWIAQISREDTVPLKLVCKVSQHPPVLGLVHCTQSSVDNTKNSRNLAITRVACSSEVS